MLTSPKQAKTALAAQIQARTGINSSRGMPNIITPPQVAILPNSSYAKYGITLGEATAHLPVQVVAPTELNLIVAYFVVRADLLDAQDACDDALVTIPDAIFWDATLGGVVDYAEVINVLAYGDIVVNDQTFFHTKIAVNVSITPDLGA